MKNLTDKQSRIYKFIVAWQRENGYPPTQAEIRDHLRFGNLNSVRCHLVLIEKKGYIHLNRGKARGIQLVLPPVQAFRQHEGSIPLLGTIAAGVPIWAEENIEDHLPIPPAFFGGGELFALNVSGDSMIGAGISTTTLSIMENVINGHNLSFYGRWGMFPANTLSGPASARLTFGRVNPEVFFIA